MEGEKNSAKILSKRSLKIMIASDGGGDGIDKRLEWRTIDRSDEARTRAGIGTTSCGTPHSERACKQYRWRLWRKRRDKSGRGAKRFIKQRQEVLISKEVTWFHSKKIMKIQALDGNRHIPHAFGHSKVVKCRTYRCRFDTSSKSAKPVSNNWFTVIGESCGR